MSKPYKTFRKEKWLYFALSIVAFFLPMVITTACLLPIVQAASGIKIAVGFGVMLLNSLIFLSGIFHNFRAHFPMLNLPALIYLFLREFFLLPIFANFADILSWIELAAFFGSIASCILWGLHRKYARYVESVKATVASGAFQLKGDKK